ncbi:RNA polymerase sigma factor [Zunongwangia pacifica]|uniref:RNA polymerase sigma-70 factor n=1 Tax=Zunongwangia pacifica TaxID=2911062 RepID=A0A9X2A045_9FLAO|nr:RNA polymerase sigma-70 factor [Zunongwangia pacifica]MCL6220898.1 RNA polymerase sigma-70 factor [Zunongwangia pacifica]
MSQYSFKHNEKLIHCLRAGDSQCFQFIFNELVEPLTAFIYTYTRDEALAEDIVQHSFMKLWEKRTFLDPQASLKTFLFTITHNRFIDLYRKDKKQVYLTDTIYMETVLETEELNEENLKPRLEQIDKAIESLPKKCREVFLLKREHNLKNREIAEYLGISIKTVEDHISRALRIIRQQVLGLLILILTSFFK